MSRLCFILLILLCALPARARSAKGTAADSAQAQQEVLTALSVGNPGHALEIINRAFRADPDPAFLYQLGLVAQAQGRSVAALDLYRRYQEIVGAAVNQQTTSAIEHFAAGMTEPVTVLNITANPGMLLCVDDQIVGVLPLRTPLLLASGAHRFRLEGTNDRRYESGPLTIPEAREAELRLTPGAKQTLVALLSLSPITVLLLQSKSQPAAATQAVLKSLVDAVRRSHLAPLPQARLDAAVRKQPADCLEQPDCQYAVAEETQARSVLRVTVKETDPKEATPQAPLGGCTATISYLDINAGHVTSTAEAKSPVCSGATLSDALTDALERLVSDANGRPRGMVSVTSIPMGARVRVDGLLRGQTPYLKASFRGVHQIVVEKTGFHPFRSQVEVTVGQVATVRAELSAIPPDPPEPPPAPLQIIAGQDPSAAGMGRKPRPRWRLALGGVALGGGLLVAGLGTSALTLDGQCTQPPADGSFCRGTYSTGAVGGGLLGVGLALSVGGVVLLALPGPSKKE